MLRQMLQKLGCPYELTDANIITCCFMCLPTDTDQKLPCFFQNGHTLYPYASASLVLFAALNDDREVRNLNSESSRLADF
jgi:hypothetical protein